MSTTVDTNVLVDLLAGDERSARAASAALEAASERGAVVICPAVYAELLAFPGRTADAVDALLTAAGIGVDWSVTESTWRRAGKAFSEYAARRRRSGAGSPRRILADLLIGAHAIAVGTLLTREGRFYRSTFSELAIEDPAGT